MELGDILRISFYTLRMRVHVRLNRASLPLCAGLVLACAGLTTAAGIAGAGRSSAEEPRMIEVTGEGAKYWPRWRGPSGQGMVTPGKYSNTWTPSTMVKWKIALPGAGNSSPIVWGDRIYLTTAYERGGRLSMLAYQRSDGRKLWETFLPQATS